MASVPEKFIPLNYQQCKLSVMDNISDPNITFDDEGISNYYYEYKNFADQQQFTEVNKSAKLNEFIKLIKASGKNKKYDCIIGLSGGVDSSYLAYLARYYELKPLIVHFDYGWNTDLAISNIENITKKLGYELYTYVIDWEMIRDLQQSYYKASVVDLDVPADHTIFGSIFKIASKFGIKYILNGSNYQTELIMPKSWNYLKTDLINIKNIHRQFGKLPFKGIPTNGVIDQIYYRVRGIVNIPLLYYVDYNIEKVHSLLKNELEWKDYEGKHFENIFTRFYQGFVLPNKFGIDKRKAHLSNLIFSGQMQKKQALDELSKPPYDLRLQLEDKDYVAKKLGFDTLEFDEILKLPNISHEHYGTDLKLRENIVKISSIFLPSNYSESLRRKIIKS
ncbi:MAG: N-acetyl sugar amidotransferase [Chitinophagia bacterium]|jgi:N-acetyl sugar amidotransferase